MNFRVFGRSEDFFYLIKSKTNREKSDEVKKAVVAQTKF